MSFDATPSRGRRVRFQPVGLALALAVCVTLLLIGLTGGLLFYVLLAGAALALVGLLHYAAWGHTALPAPGGPPGAGAPPDAWQHARDVWQETRDRGDRH
jgi:hypothetical protein